MDESSSRSAENRGLKTTIQYAIIGLLLIACVFMVYLTLLARRLTVTMEAMSENVTTVMATTARVAKHVDNVEKRLHALFQDVDIAGAAAGAADVARSLGGEAVEMEPRAEGEITWLFGQIRSSKARFAYDDTKKSALSFYMRLYAKYKVYKKTIASAEDFIDKVATKTITGKPYYITEPGGKQVELGQWLRAKLAARRKSAPAH